MPSIIIFGATGFIGAPLSRNLKAAHPSWPLTAFVRPGRAEETVKTDLHVDSVIFGDIFDHEAVAKASEAHDIAINAATSFDGRVVTAMVEGLKHRKAEGKGKLIHLSGAG